MQLLRWTPCWESHVLHIPPPGFTIVMVKHTPGLEEPAFLQKNLGRTLTVVMDETYLLDTFFFFQAFKRRYLEHFAMKRQQMSGVVA